MLKQKGFIPLTLLIPLLLISGIVISGTFYLKNYSPPITELPKYTKITELPIIYSPIPNSQSTPPSPDITANWKTYSSKNLNISFKLPDGPNGSSVTKETRDTITVQPLSLTITKDPSFFTNYNAIKKCSGAKENQICIVDYLGNGRNRSIYETTLDHIPAVNFFLGGYVDYAEQVIQTTQEPRIELKMDVAGGGLDGLFTNILSTFKFLPASPAGGDQTIDTSNWRVYVSKDFHFKINYPNDWIIQESSIQYLQNQNNKQIPTGDITFKDSKNNTTFSIIVNFQGSGCDGGGCTESDFTTSTHIVGHRWTSPELTDYDFEVGSNNISISTPTTTSLNLADTVVKSLASY